LVSVNAPFQREPPWTISAIGGARHDVFDQREEREFLELVEMHKTKGVFTVARFTSAPPF